MALSSTVDVVVDDVVDDVEDVLLLVVGLELVDDSAGSSLGLHAARRSVSETNPAIAVRIRRILRMGAGLAGITR